MNLWMDPLGDALTTGPIQTGYEFTIELYSTRWLGFIDNMDCQFYNGSVWTRTRTRSDGPETLVTLPAGKGGRMDNFGDGQYPGRGWHREMPKTQIETTTQCVVGL